MKRVLKTLLLVAALFGIFALVFFKWLMLDRTAPGYQVARVQPAIGKLQDIFYEFLNPSPFEGGKMWISLSANSNDFHCYLYDIDRRLVLGELINASPCFLNHDQTILLCAQRKAPPMDPTRARIIEVIKKISGGRIDLASSKNDTETFWALDLRRNAATRLGQDQQWRGAGSSFFPSPGFRYGYNKPTASFTEPGLIVCDLEKNEFRKDPVDAWPVGWWDDHQIMAKATNNDFVLYDVLTRQISPFLRKSQIKEFYESNGITCDAAAAKAFFMWNGCENEFYLTDGNSRWSAVASFLAKIGRPGPTLTLVSPDYKFEWSDHFNAAGDRYLYTGRDSGKTNSAVYLRDLHTGRTRELVAPDPNNRQLFSIPFVYNDRGIYLRSNMLWQVDLDGGNNRRLFPP